MMLPMASSLLSSGSSLVFLLLLASFLYLFLFSCSSLLFPFLSSFLRFHQLATTKRTKRTSAAESVLISALPPTASLHLRLSIETLELHCASEPGLQVLEVPIGIGEFEAENFSMDRALHRPGDLAYSWGDSRMHSECIQLGAFQARCIRAICWERHSKSILQWSKTPMPSAHRTALLFVYVCHSAFHSGTNRRSQVLRFTGSLHQVSFRSPSASTWIRWLTFSSRT